MNPPRPLIGDRLEALSEAIDGADLDEMANVVRAAPADLRSIDGYIALVRQQAARGRLAAPTPAPTPEPPPLPELGERPAPAVFAAGVAGAFEALRGSRRYDDAGEALECETGTGGS